MPLLCFLMLLRFLLMLLMLMLLLLISCLHPSCNKFYRVSLCDHPPLPRPPSNRPIRYVHRHIRRRREIGRVIESLTKGEFTFTFAWLRFYRYSYLLFYDLMTLLGLIWLMVFVLNTPCWICFHHYLFHSSISPRFLLFTKLASPSKSAYSIFLITLGQTYCLWSCQII